MRNEVGLIAYFSSNSYVLSYYIDNAHAKDGLVYAVVCFAVPGEQHSFASDLTHDPNYE
jgi:hypothetical protein